jgi:predicted RNase H-like HicB family nuclease
MDWYFFVAVCPWGECGHRHKTYHEAVKCGDNTLQLKREEFRVHRITIPMEIAVRMLPSIVASIAIIVLSYAFSDVIRPFVTEVVEHVMEIVDGVTEVVEDVIEIAREPQDPDVD